MNLIDSTGRDATVRLLGYEIGSRPFGGGKYGHLYLEIEDTETGQAFIARGGQRGYSPVGAASDSAQDGVHLRTQIGPAAESVDSAVVQERGLEVDSVDYAYVRGNAQDILNSVGDFVSNVNAADVDYKPQSQNSNTFAGDVFERLAGRPPNADAQMYPGVENDLPVKEARTR